MEGSPGPSDLQEQLKEREAEVGVLRNPLSQAQEEIDRLRRENEQLRQELRASGRGRARGQSKRKAKRKRSGRKAGKGRFTFRGAPASAVTKGPSQPVPVTLSQCTGGGAQGAGDVAGGCRRRSDPECPQPRCAEEDHGRQRKCLPTVASRWSPGAGNLHR